MVIPQRGKRSNKKGCGKKKWALLQICFGWPQAMSAVMKEWESVYLFVFLTPISSDMTGI